MSLFVVSLATCSVLLKYRRKAGKNADIKRILEKEGEQMLAAIPKGNRILR